MGGYNERKNYWQYFKSIQCYIFYYSGFICIHKLSSVSDRSEIIEKAQNGDASSQVELGIRYADGSYGMPQDYRLANHWYKKAIEQNNPYAMHNLALSYIRGQGVETDYTQARFYFSKACNLNIKESCDNLQKMNNRGMY
ncbi:sel1 repeat family protein [Muribacter muris]|uniref:Sel1 repeat family protein n=1 Tax=Muribacter muris TaxID=67855 RepID=A0A4Y9K7T8_9PAST|nr:tetratricopeptide repeat protein [Muribacter muris]MBF0784128.1 sel1 repeat family protein [Muribacter muris]MBF0827623.1 sel1 repeat family protein [Muribacter muris]TFV13180.1 sel1 repeat family protein [Muribacter muris]